MYKRDIKILVILPLMVVFLFWSIITNAKILDIKHMGEVKILSKWIKTHYLHKNPNKAHSLAEAIVTTADKRNQDPFLLASIIASESSFKVNARNKSAVGLMGIIPRYHKQAIRGRNIMDPKVNIDVGSITLKEYTDANNGNIKQALSNYRGLRYELSKSYIAKINSYRQKLASLYEARYSVMDSISNYVVINSIFNNNVMDGRFKEKLVLN